MLPYFLTHINTKKVFYMCKLPDGTQKFSFMEMINSTSSGKTSNSGVVGFFTCLIMLIVFVTIVIYYMCIPKDVSISEIDLLKLKIEMIKDIIEYSTIFFGMGSALLGVRKIAGAVSSSKGKNAVKIVTDNTEKTN